MRSRSSSSSSCRTHRLPPIPIPTAGPIRPRTRSAAHPSPAASDHHRGGAVAAGIPFAGRSPALQSALLERRRGSREARVDVLRLDGVNKTFGRTQAVRDLAFSVEAGSMHGLVGPNGAGKTTTIRMVMQVLLPDSGRIDLFGAPSTPASLDRVGYLPEERGLYRKMRVGEVLSFFGKLKGLSAREARRRGGAWLERLEMADAARRKVQELSKGNQQKIQMAATLLHDPGLIILDEPFAGLDPMNVELVRDILLERKAAGAAIIFSTHEMEHVERLCDGICMIDRGRAVLRGRLAEVRKRFGTDTVLLAYDGDAGFLRDLPYVRSVDDAGHAAEIRLADPERAQDLLRAAAERLRIRRFEVTEPSLRQIFVETVRKADGA
ncbi:MAG: ATP-binding cassette domain-containing protein [Planctomycetes bacterium]|nr:ATP-binding cassette domain-containing protein [Planctomycetota bacterium]